MTIFGKLPRRQEAASIYGVIVGMDYGWTLILFSWKLPSWLRFMRADEVLSALAYATATAFTECTLVLCALVLLDLVLPSKWFRDRFVSRATVLVILGLAYMMYIASLLNGEEAFPKDVIFNGTPIFVIAAAFFAVALSKVDPVRKALENFADRTIIFLYIFLPLSALSLVVIAIRNLF